MDPEHYKIRKAAWDEIIDRHQNQGYSDDLIKAFTAGLFVMWRLCGDGRPLFTYGCHPNGLPNELQDENMPQMPKGNEDTGPAS